MLQGRETEIKCKCGAVIARIDERGRVKVGHGQASGPDGVVECPGCHETLKTAQIRNVAGPQVRA